MSRRMQCSVCEPTNPVSTAREMDIVSASLLGPFDPAVYGNSMTFTVSHAELNSARAGVFSMLAREWGSL